MRKKSKSGITINDDIALESYMEEEQKQPSADTRNEFAKVYPLYNTPRLRVRKSKERNGPVKHKYQIMNQQNEESNVIRCIKDKDTVGVVVSVLLAAKIPYNYQQIADRAMDSLRRYDSGKLLEKHQQHKKTIGPYQMRNALGRLMRSGLGDRVRKYSKSNRRKRAEYQIKVEYINSMSFDEAIKLARLMPKYKKRAKLSTRKPVLERKEVSAVEQLGQEIADQIMEKVVNIKVNVTFSFKVE